MMETKTQVSTRHKEEWIRFRERFLEAALEDESAAKLAKIYADVLKIYQEGERKAFGFCEDEVDNSLSVTWNE